MTNPRHMLERDIERQLRSGPKVHAPPLIVGAKTAAATLLDSIDRHGETCSSWDSARRVGSAATIAQDATVKLFTEHIRSHSPPSELAVSSHVLVPKGIGLSLHNGSVILEGQIVDPMGGAGVHYWPRIAERYGLKLTVIDQSVDPTFRFIPADRDGQIRMAPSSPYAMKRLTETREHFDLSFACDTDQSQMTSTLALGNPLMPIPPQRLEALTDGRCCGFRSFLACADRSVSAAPCGRGTRDPAARAPGTRAAGSG